MRNDKIEIKTDVFHKRCGEILRMALHVETSLDFFISNYFCYPQSYKTFLLSDLILIKLGFERKVQIFREICKKEEIDKEEIKKIIKSIDFVKTIRNKVAHSEAFIGDPTDGIKLQTRESVKYKKDELKLTEELIKRVDKNRLSAIRGIVQIYLKLSKPSREK